MIEKLQKLRAFLGPEAFGLCLVAVLVGLLQFSVEMSFVYVLQGFLLSINLLQPEMTFLPSWYPHDILSSSLIFIFFGFMRAFGTFMRYYTIGTITQAFYVHQRSMLLEYALYNSSTLATYEIVSTFVERVNSAGYVLTRLTDLTIITTSLVFLGSFALRIAPIELVIALALLLTLIYPLTFFKRRIAEIAIDIDRTWKGANASIINSVKNNFFLKVHGMLNNELVQGKQNLKEFEGLAKSYQVISALNGVVPAFTGIVVIALVSYISITYIQTPAMKLVSFFYIFMRLAQAASDAYSAVGEVRLNKLAFQQIYSWNDRLIKFKSENKTMLVSENTDSDKRFDQVVFKGSGLGFSYESGKTIFSNLHFNVGPGEVLLLRGPSGAGKSTLLAVLMGVFVPTDGEVTVNGKPVHESLGILRNSLAFVGPEPYLKPGTIRENLLYGHPNPKIVEDKDILRVLSQCHISEVVKPENGGLDQFLYEFAQLSTGQKQRLSLARALLRDPRLLILDEATANLDRETEEDIIRSLTPIMKKMTVVIVSHKETFNHLATETVALKSHHSSSVTQLAIDKIKG